MNPIAEAAYRPHDLLWLRDASAWALAMGVEGMRPAWATPAWLAVAPVVVRRGIPVDAAKVPVGLRGVTRGERCAAHVDIANVARVITPEEIGRLSPEGRGSNTRGGDDARSPPVLACLQTLARLAPALNALPIPWGVTGSVGFALASGLNVLRPDSDLDLLVRAPRATDAQALRAIGGLLKDAPARVDVQVEVDAGAFALQEWLRTGGPVLLKTNAGPRLVEEPWAP